MPDQTNSQELREVLIDIVTNTLQSESAHHMHVINEILAQGEERLNSQLKERLELLDTFFRRPCFRRGE